MKAIIARPVVNDRNQTTWQLGLLDSAGSCRSGAVAFPCPRAVVEMGGGRVVQVDNAVELARSEQFV